MKIFFLNLKKALAPMCTLFFRKIHKTLKDEKENCYASLSSLFLLMRMHIEMGIESRKSDCGSTYCSELNADVALHK